jgi:hypothetical protein
MAIAGVLPLNSASRCSHDDENRFMEITIGKFLSLVIAIGYLVMAAIDMALSEQGITYHLLGFVVILLFPLALIWFPEELGSFTGYVGRGGYIDTESPPALISFMGWLFLVGPALLACVMYFVS